MASSPSYTTLVAGQSPAQTEKITTALSTGGHRLPAVQQRHGCAGRARQRRPGARRARRPGSAERLLQRASRPSSARPASARAASSSRSRAPRRSSSSSTQTIEGMNGINQAEIQLAIPNQADNLFTGTNTQATRLGAAEHNRHAGRQRGQVDRRARRRRRHRSAARARSRSPTRTATCCGRPRPPPSATR